MTTVTWENTSISLTRIRSDQFPRLNIHNFEIREHEIIVKVYLWAQILSVSIITFFIDNYLFNKRSTQVNTHNTSANIGQHLHHIGQHSANIGQHSANNDHIIYPLLNILYRHRDIGICYYLYIIMGESERTTLRLYIIRVK